MTSLGPEPGCKCGCNGSYGPLANYLIQVSIAAQLKSEAGPSSGETMTQSKPKYACRKCGATEFVGQPLDYPVYEAIGGTIVFRRTESTELNDETPLPSCRECGEAIAAPDNPEIAMPEKSGETMTQPKPKYACCKCGHTEFVGESDEYPIYKAVGDVIVFSHMESAYETSTLFCRECGEETDAPDDLAIS